METYTFSFAAWGRSLPAWGFEVTALNMQLQNGMDGACLPRINSSKYSELLKPSMEFFALGTHLHPICRKDPFHL